MLTGGPMGRERYRTTKILLTQEQADFLWAMTNVTEGIMQEREEARRKDAERNREG